VKTYEGLFIFNDTLPEERVKEAAGRVGAEIDKSGGRVLETRPLGRRQFSRQLDKKDGGFYVSILFQSEESKVGTLPARFKLEEEIFRFQITIVEPKKPAKKPAAAAPVATAE
jgi:small subunit ribosomal protein S6